MIDKATTSYVVAVLAACVVVVVIHDGYFSRRLPSQVEPVQHPQAIRTRPGALLAPPVSPSSMPAPSVPTSSEDVATLAVASLPDGDQATATGDADVSSSDHEVERPFRIARDRQCHAHQCAAWTALDLDTGKKSGAVIDLAPLNLAPAIASPARRGLVDLLIIAKALPDPDSAGAVLHLRAVKLEGVAPHHLAFRAPLSPAHGANRHSTTVAHVSLPDWPAPNGF
jgi:hypothetical protein